MAVAKSKTKRIIIIVVLILMLGGTIGSFVMIILGQNNQTTITEQQTKELMERWQKALDEENALVAKQTKELSDQYYSEFVQYKKKPKAFNAQTIKEVAINDLKTGSGEEIKEGTTYRAYYLGWTPDGKTFDSSFEGKSLKMPLDGAGGMIQGWNEGVLGMRIGGVREISIPSDKAYGETGNGSIKPNTPLKFIIKAIGGPSKEHQAERKKLDEKYADLQQMGLEQN